LFLYREVLKKDLDESINAVRAKTTVFAYGHDERGDYKGDYRSPSRPSVDHKAHLWKRVTEAQRAKLVPAFREPRAIKLLQLLNRDSHTGESLNKIYELAEGHPSRRKEFDEHFGISEVEFRRFADAVHNPVVSGELARHAYEDKPKTVNPMSIAEAESFAMEIARRWLSSLSD
jgi:hypothetical protein